VFRRRQRSDAVDFLMLDWMLPDGSVLDLADWVRSLAKLQLRAQGLSWRVTIAA